MAREYDNTNSGASFVNDKKTAENHPDYRGSINVEGKEYWISSWVKTAGPNARNPGSKFLSHSLQVKEAVAAQELEAAPMSVTGNTGSGGFATPDFKEVPVDDQLPGDLPF